MSRFEINNNVLSSFFWKGQNVILPWGIEFADDDSFFSLEKGIGHRIEVLNESYKIEDNIYSYEQKIKLHTGVVEIHGRDVIGKDKIYRKINLVAVDNVKLLDFVMRFRFIKDGFEIASISGDKILHKDTNKYYQYECKDVNLNGAAGNVKICIIDQKIISDMRQCMYVRDHKGEWVVHARMLPKYDKNIVIKLCSKFFDTKPLPHFLTRILCSNEKVYTYLKYHNELKPYKNIIARTVNPNAYPMIDLQAGECLEFEVEVIFSE